VSGVGGVDASSDAGDPDARRADEDDWLRREEVTLGEAYKRNPGDRATMGALVRAQQAIRKRSEDAARVADNALPSQSADEQMRGYGIRLPMAPADAGAVHLDRSVSHLSTSKEVKEEIDAITRTISFATFAGAGFAANLDPKLLVRLGELKARLPQIERAERATIEAPRAALSPFHAHAEAHEGNAAQVAEMRVELSTVLRADTFPTALATMTYANQYIAYTAKHPEMRDLHDHAVANFQTLVDDATDREARRAEGEQRAHDQAAWLQIHSAPGSGLLIAEGALGLLSAQTVHTIAGLVPVAAEVQSALEALTAHGMWGLGEEKIEGVDRLLVGVTALCALAPFAREVLKGAEAEETVAGIARESGKTVEEIRGLLQASVQIANSKAEVRAALTKAGAGEAIDDGEREAVGSVRAANLERLGVNSGDAVRAARREAPLHVDEHPTGSGGGPGMWKEKPEAMSPSAAAYQERVTGVRACKHAYIVDGADFDGVKAAADGKVSLLDAKDRYEQFLGKDGEPKFFMKWESEMVAGLRTKAIIAAEHGATFEVHCSQSAVAARLRRDVFGIAGSILIVDDGAQ
jgi:predicted transcriptional regulator